MSNENFFIDFKNIELDSDFKGSKEFLLYKNETLNKKRDNQKISNSAIDLKFNKTQNNKDSESLFDEMKLVLDGEITKLKKIDHSKEINTKITFTENNINQNNNKIYKPLSKNSNQSKSEKNKISNFKKDKNFHPIIDKNNIKDSNSSNKKENHYKNKLKQTDTDLKKDKVRITTPFLHPKLDTQKFQDFHILLNNLNSDVFSLFYKESYSEELFPHLFCPSERISFLKKFPLTKKIMTKPCISSYLNSDIVQVITKKNCNLDIEKYIYLVKLSDNTELHITENLLKCKINSQSEIPKTYQNYIY